MIRKSRDKNSGFTQVSQVVRSIIKNLEKPQKLQEAHLFELWKNLVDPEVGRRATPKRLCGRKLYIHVSQPHWAHELTLNYKNKILVMLQEKVGKENLEDIQFLVGRIEP